MKTNENRFAKIFELSHHQILLTKSYNDDEDAYIVTQTTLIDGTSCEVKAGFFEESDALAMFDGYNISDAKEFFTDMSTMMNQPK